MGALARLEEWAEPPDVLVVDNGSPDVEVARLRKGSGRAGLLALPANVGYGAAHNLALERVSTPWTLLLNADAALGEDDARRLLDAQADEPGIVGPLLTHVERGRRWTTAGGRDVARHMRTHALAGERQREIDTGLPFAVPYVPGTVALAPTELLHRLQGFEESYFFSAEVADLCSRADEAGVRSRIEPQAEAVHELDVAGNLRDGLYRYYSLRNRFLYVLRRLPASEHGRLRARWTARGLARVCHGALTGRLSRARHLALAVRHGRRGRFGAAPASLTAGMTP